MIAAIRCPRPPRPTWAFSLALLLAVPAFAQQPPASGTKPEPAPTATASESNPAVPAPGHSLHGETFDEGPRQAAVLLDGMGRIKFPVTTKSPQAQAFVNQGVGQVHSFLYLEAERSFRQAALLDPDCGMAYWGMAMANVNNGRRAQGFLREAEKRRGKLSPREVLYLDALKANYGAGDAKTKRQGMLKGLEAVVQEYPDDIDARAWLAMVTWQNGTQDGIGSRQAVDVLLDSVMAVEPLHPGAHHYRIHLWDHQKAARALKSAATYAKTAPGIAHAWHMPGHTYTELRRYADAAYQQEGSARVDHAYMSKSRVMPFEIHNYAHNNQWLCTTLSHIGRVRDALTVARNLVEQPRDPRRNTKGDGGSAQREGRARWSEILVKYELWDELIDAAESGALDWSDLPMEKRQKLHTLGLAYAAKENAAKLAEQVAALKAIGDEEAKTRAGKTASPEVLSALAELEGHQKLAAGDVDAAFASFAKVTSMRPEALARAHLKARNYGFAVKRGKEAADKASDQLVPLATYVETLAAAGRTKEASEAYAKLEPMLRDADRDAPIVKRIAEIVRGWEGTSEWKARPRSAESETDDARAGRVDLTTLGPLGWTPYEALPLSLKDTEGQTWTLADRRGKNVIVLFYLGEKCVHCLEQLRKFGKEVDAFAKLGTEVVAVGSDTPEGAKALKAVKDGGFSMPILANPGLEAFRAYGAYDNFEELPLHGVFLIDAKGAVRYQKLSAEPFLDVDFLKTETARVNRLQGR